MTPSQPPEEKEVAKVFSSFMFRAGMFGVDIAGVLIDPIWERPAAESVANKINKALAPLLSKASEADALRRRAEAADKLAEALKETDFRLGGLLLTQIIGGEEHPTTLREFCGYQEALDAYIASVDSPVKKTPGTKE